MKILVPANNKGGVGKTNTSSLFAEYSAKILNKKVLGIDFDPQCNFSQRYLNMEIDPAAPEGWIPPIHPDYDPTDPDDDHWDGRSSIADIFYGGGVVPYPTYIDGFDITPAYAHKLLAAEAVRKNEVVEKVHNRMYEFLLSDDVQQEYDLIIIDTAPSKGPLTVSAIKAATHIIIPAVMEDKPIQGVYGMLQLWMQESLNRDSKHKLALVGILPNMFNGKTTLHNEMYQSLVDNDSIGKYMIPTKLGHRVIFAETDSSNANPRSIFDLSDSNIAKKEALAACEFIARSVFE
jgi:chromosome partitioning protein